MGGLGNGPGRRRATGREVRRPWAACQARPRRAVLVALDTPGQPRRRTPPPLGRALPSLLATGLALQLAGCNCDSPGSQDAGQDAGHDAGQPAGCTAGAACTSNPGAPCRQGVTVCAPALACADGPAAPDGTACTGGLCGGGGCRASLTVTGSADLSRDALTPGRGCAEAPAYPVLAASGSGLAVEGPVDAGCLEVGDEVLLIDLQGTGDAVAEVGAWEVHRVASLAGEAVGLDGPLAHAFGPLGDGGQQVALVRLPGFGALTVASGAVVSARPWDGRLGGVVAMRAQQLQVEGTISAQALGYRGGRWSRDDTTCSKSVQTEAGESIGGRGLATTAANAGGSGGVGPGVGASYNSDVPTSATAGHALPGSPGGNYGIRDAGEPGHAYGRGDGGSLTLGSAGSGSVTCEVGFPGPALVEFPMRAGGIILLYAGRLQVGDGGLITAAGTAYDARWAGAGGSVMLRGGVLELGEGQVSAAGGVEPANRGVPPTAASPGYVSVFFSASASGTTDPPAFTLQVPAP